MAGQERPPIRLAMVGGGEGAFIGEIHRTAARLDGRYVLMAGAFSGDEQRSRASGHALGLAPERCYGDWRDMLARETQRSDGAQAVAVVTPNHLHAAVAMACLEAGLHVLCDKPLTATLEEAEALATVAQRSRGKLCVTYNYSGYPMVRHARELVRRGALGDIRSVQARYAQDWLALPVERNGNKQAAWRTDPARAGGGGCIGDIGTHAYQLLCFVTDLSPQSLLADLQSAVPGRALDDNAQILLRFNQGARGMLWASQTAPGRANHLALEVYGSRGGLRWCQEEPDDLWFTPLGEPTQRLRRGAIDEPGARTASRLPAGHPEGYLEAFANLYRDFADAIQPPPGSASSAQRPETFPGLSHGLHGLRFVDAALRSSRSGGVWVELHPPLG